MGHAGNSMDLFISVRVGNDPQRRTVTGAELWGASAALRLGSIDDPAA